MSVVAGPAAAASYEATSPALCVHGARREALVIAARRWVAPSAGCGLWAVSAWPTSPALQACHAWAGAGRHPAG
jgi:hypothetical protein